MPKNKFVVFPRPLRWRGRMKRVRAEQAGGTLPSGCRRRRMQRRTEVIPADTGAARKVFQSDDLGLTFYTSLVPNEKKIKNKLDPWDEGKGMCDLCVDVCVILTQQLGSFLESWTDWMGWKSLWSFTEACPWRSKLRECEVTRQEVTSTGISWVFSMANTWQIHEFEGEVTVRQFEADSVRVFGMLRCSAMVVWNGSSKAGQIVRTSKRPGLYSQPLEAPVCHRSRV